MPKIKVLPLYPEKMGHLYVLAPASHEPAVQTPQGAIPLWRTSGPAQQGPGCAFALSLAQNAACPSFCPWLLRSPVPSHLAFLAKLQRHFSS